MKLEIAALRDLLGKVTKVDHLIRMESAAGRLVATARDIDCRIAISIACDGDMDPIYLKVEPLVKAVQLRASDIPADITADANTIRVQHGEFSMKLPMSKDSLDPLIYSQPPSPMAGPLREAIASAYAATENDEKLGVLLCWSNGRARTIGAAQGFRLVHVFEWSCEPGSGRFSMSKQAAAHLVSLGQVDRWWLEDGRLFVASPSAVLRINPTRDNYPKSDFVGELAGSDPVMMCWFDRLNVEFAVRCASSVLGDDTNVTLSCDQRAGPDAVIFRVTGRNSITGASASEAFLGRTSQPIAWSGKLNAGDLRTSLASSHSEQISVILSDKTVKISNDPFIGFLRLMG